MQLYNTLGRQLEELKPVVPGKVGMYCCGPTVYNFAHIGNLRTYIFEDILRRTIEYSGLTVNHVMNVTDVGHLTGDDDSGDDKMVNSAKEKNKSVLEVAKYYTDAFFADCIALNIKRPTVVCPATEHIQDMIDLIKKIEANGYTYQAGGNLYFDISKFPKYGELAMLKLSEMQAGARIEVDANKRNPYDFVLWFTKSKFEGQALVWDSPWGRGYPGWHIECSAMSMKYLGETFDIHTGGIDHITVHHTNEIAQSEAATGKKWVNYWVHGEFLVLSKGKMSKSAGGFITLKSIVQEGYEALDYRYFCLGGHYRSQLKFTWESMDASRSARLSLNDMILAIKDKAVFPNPLLAIAPEARAYLDSFTANANADLAMPRCLADLQGVVRDSSLNPKDALCVVYEMDRILALGFTELARKEEAPVDPKLASEIDALVNERIEAKKAKNFARADEIRNVLKDKGVVIEDSKDGTKWKLV